MNGETRTHRHTAPQHEIVDTSEPEKTRAAQSLSKLLAGAKMVAGFVPQWSIPTPTSI